MNNSVIVYFYRGNTLVRTEVCYSVFDAEALVSEESELNRYTSINIVTGD